MRAVARSIIARNKFIKGTVANPINFLKWGKTDINLPDILPDHITPYSLNHGKDEVHFVETAPEYSLLGKPFMYHEQFKQAQRVLVVSHDEWFGWAQSQPDPDRPIFVCGIGRSGTTLINRALHRLPDTSVYDEPDVFMQMVRLSPEERYPLIHASSASLNRHGTRLVMKQRSFVSYMMDSILDVYPNAKILFLYRNTFDWIRSNMRLILRTPTPPGIVHEVVRLVFKRYLPALNPAEFRPLQMVEAGALLWLKFNQHYANLIEQGYPILGVRYEDMVDDPDSVLPQIFDFCGLPLHQVETALPAFNRNSQAGTIFSRKNLAKIELTARQIRLIQGMLDRHEWLNDAHMRLPGSVVPRKRELTKPLA
ncbi:MAG: sulfotransferase family protein [Anaerolineae bacterium]